MIGSRRNWHDGGVAIQAYVVRWRGLVRMGKAWHNDHHAFPASARLGLDGSKSDPDWWVLCARRRAQLVWNVKTPDMLPNRPDLHARGRHAELPRAA